MNDFYKTKVLIEIEVEHQFDPQRALDLIQNRLNVPAVSELIFLTKTSNYRLHQPPAEKMELIKENSILETIDKRIKYISQHIDSYQRSLKISCSSIDYAELTEEILRNYQNELKFLVNLRQSLEHTH